MSNFAFLQPQWADLRDAAGRAERLVYADPRASCFYARRALEIAVAWLYKHDASVHLPYQDHLSALIHEPGFRTTVGDAVYSKARVLKDLGNHAVHSTRPVRQIDALRAVKELFHVCYWLARTYGPAGSSVPDLAFDPEAIPKVAPAAQKTAEQLKAVEAELRARDEKLADLLTAKTTLNAELEQLRAEVAAAKQANQSRPDTHDYSEAETRDFFIDLLLKEAGWALDVPRDREFAVSGMPNAEGKGFVDYVLWGTDGKPLGIVEAKRTKRDPRVGQQQAKLYADCLEQQFGQRPIIFYSNGYEHWMWDDQRYPPHPVQGFYKRPELELLIQRRSTLKVLADAPVSSTIVERYYQTRAIRRIGESFERDHLRKALVVMATGAGKTRTVIALCELLMRCNWAKRVLFLADRVALVNQAVNAFKTHLPEAPPVNLVTDPTEQGRVYVSTYPTMMNLIEEANAGERRFGVGHFDLVVIDEAHRSVYQKYRAIFDYFDSLLLGLTATPKDEIDRNTYGLFDLEKGVPTDSYGLDEAVTDGFLLPPVAISVPLKFPREGIKYDELPEEEQDQWDALEWEENERPDFVDPEALNKWLFNIDTVDKVLEHLMTRGQTVAGGDRLGKTIVFAKSQDHADFIEKRFNINYSHYKGQFARVITFRTEYAQSLIDDFSSYAKLPQIAVSVDMLDTGIDIPDVVNLVFFKRVRSTTKFWQMIGRGTRLRRDLFGPGQDKEFFYIFDYCQNLEFFRQNHPVSEGAVGESLGVRLFKTRLALIVGLDAAADDERRTGSVGLDRERSGLSHGQLRTETADFLRAQVAAMNLNNIVVRPHRRLVERYAQPEAWTTLGPEQVGELAGQVARLPTELTDEDEEAKRFDLLILRVQLAVLNADATFTGLRDRVRELVGGLLDTTTSSIPMVREQLVLIEEVAGEEWWQDVTLPMLEVARRRLRSLMKFIDKVKRKPIYTDFEDELGVETTVTLSGIPTGANPERFRAKVRQFLKAHESHITLRKVRLNHPLTPSDLAELERMLLDAGIGTADDIARATEHSQGFGLFIRSLVGLDREAAKQAFGGFLGGGRASANQVEFVNLIVDYLTEHGVMDAALLYESPFIDTSPRGPEGLFSSEQVDQLVGVLREIHEHAAA